MTCRDWFQLTLKEGLTVFRDQQFTADQTSAAVKRIDDVVSLRGRQFAEDSGPMAHPIRPESYIAMDNFYTATVYDKGAEIIRMYYTRLGADGFRRGMDLYFERHDNDAVTCDDFRAAMADANNADLSLMDRWYSQPGTPEVTATESWDDDAGSYTLSLSQTYPPLPDSIPGAANRTPVPIPVKTALLDAGGNEVPLRLESEPEAGATESLLMLETDQQSWTFTGLAKRPVASVLRGFSAPVRLEMERDDRQLAFLMAHDSDTFNRWDAGQTLVLRLLTANASGEDITDGDTLGLYLEAIGKQMQDQALDGSYLALLLTLPSEATIGQAMKVVDPEAVHNARQFVKRQIATTHANWFQSTYDSLVQRGSYQNDQPSIDARRLKNTALAYLSIDGTDAALALAARQFDESDNMTDTVAALRVLADHPGPHSEAALKRFYDKYSHMPLVLNKWFAVQATADHDKTLERVVALTQHGDFTVTNPNRVRSLLQAFTMNQSRFHRSDGVGYELLADFVIKIDPNNPQLASRLVSRLNDYRRFEPNRQTLMRSQLERIAAVGSLSKDVREIVERALQF